MSSIGRCTVPVVMAVDDLTNWLVDRVPHQDLARLAWRYHKTVSAYDALYVATARAHHLPLLTADGRLDRASNLGIAIQHIRIGQEHARIGFDQVF